MFSKELLVTAGLVAVVLGLMRQQARPKKQSGLTVTALNIYPIKSCRGVSVRSSRLDRMGLAWDRRFMLIGAESRTFITQRQYPKLALASPRFEDADGKVWEIIPEKPEFLVVSAPDMPDLRIPLQGMDQKEGKKDGEWFSDELVDAKLWDDIVSGQFVGAEADKWFSKFIGCEVRLVATRPGFEHKRNLPSTYDLTPSDARIEAAFPDAFPLLVINEASLTELNRRVDVPLTMANFRPNIVVSGAVPFAEDFWRRISIEDSTTGKPIVMEVVKHCDRCSLPNVDPATGERRKDGEPTKTLLTFRAVGEAVYFGQNCIHLSNGTISVQTPLEVLVRHSMDLPERLATINKHVQTSQQPFED